MSQCQTEHPEQPGVLCIESAVVINHEFHIGRGGVIWENPDFVMPEPKKTKAQHKAEKDDSAKKMLDVAREITQRSTTDRSTTDTDTIDRLPGIEQAHGAVEEEFKERAREGAIALSQELDRWTVDELWNWLDQRGHFTKHPKGMTGLLNGFIADRIIEKVPKGDEDSHRPSERTNASRLIQVYRSLL